MCMYVYAYVCICVCMYMRMYVYVYVYPSISFLFIQQEYLRNIHTQPIINFDLFSIFFYIQSVMKSISNPSLFFPFIVFPSKKHA